MKSQEWKQNLPTTSNWLMIILWYKKKRFLFVDWRKLAIQNSQVSRLLQFSVHYLLFIEGLISQLWSHNFFFKAHSYFTIE